MGIDRVINDVVARPYDISDDALIDLVAGIVTLSRCGVTRTDRLTGMLRKYPTLEYMRNSSAEFAAVRKELKDAVNACTDPVDNSTATDT